MAKTNANVNVFSDTAYAVWSAPLGSTMPSTVSGSLDAAFHEVGLLSDAGITEGHTFNETKIYDMAGSLIRIARNQEERPFTFTALEGNTTVEDLRFPGSTVTTASTTNTRPIKSGLTRNLRAWVIELKDGTVQKRIAITTGEAIWTGTTSYNGSAASVYDFTLQAFKDSSGNFYTVIDNDTAEAAGA